MSDKGHSKTIVLLLIGIMTAGAAFLLSRTESSNEASFATTIDFLSGIVRDVDHVGLTLTRVSVEKEMKIGREINDRIETETPLRLVKSSEYERYVNDVGNILLEHVKRKGMEYQFQVVFSSQINAFAIAGGYIYITTAMLDFLETEAELAGILAHEISHIDHRHCIERLQYELALRKILGKDLAAVARIGYLLVELGFSEQREFEADINGIQMAAKAGYNPSAVLDAFARLKLEEEAGQSERDKPTLMVEEIGGAVWKALEQYFASHPSFKDRLHHDSLVFERNKRSWDGQWFYNGKSNYENRLSKKQSFHVHELAQYSPFILKDYKEQQKATDTVAHSILDAKAQYELGLKYYNGHGVFQDYAKALEWFRKAAEQGNVEAQHELGVLYTGSQGVSKDYIQAYKWLYLTVVAGNTTASKRRDSIAALMTSAQIAEAKRLITEWQKRKTKVIAGASTPATKTFVRVEHTDVVYEYGKPIFEVKPGDILEVTHTQTCISGSEICWEVKSRRTGEWGFVNADIMKSRHHVYEETEQKD